MLFLTYLIYSLISFTFMGIMVLLLRDWDRLFLSIMCLTYRNRSDYWLTCPLQVKSVNRSIAILMTKKLSPVLEGLDSAWHEVHFTLHSKKDALKNLVEYWLLTELSSVNCITSLQPALKPFLQILSMDSKKSQNSNLASEGDIHLR